MPIAIEPTFPVEHSFKAIMTNRYLSHLDFFTTIRYSGIVGLYVSHKLRTIVSQTLSYLITELVTYSDLCLYNCL